MICPPLCTRCRRGDISKVKYPPREDIFTIKILKYNLEEDKMSEFKLTSVEEFEQATNELLEMVQKLALTHGSFV